MGFEGITKEKIDETIRALEVKFDFTAPEMTEQEREAFAIKHIGALFNRHTRRSMTAMAKKQARRLEFNTMRRWGQKHMRFLKKQKRAQRDARTVLQISKELEALGLLR
jgi:hypothetical protein